MKTPILVDFFILFQSSLFLHVCTFMCFFLLILAFLFDFSFLQFILFLFNFSHSGGGEVWSTGSSSGSETGEHTSQVSTGSKASSSATHNTSTSGTSMVSQATRHSVISYGAGRSSRPGSTATSLVAVSPRNMAGSVFFPDIVEIASEKKNVSFSITDEELSVSQV